MIHRPTQWKEVARLARARLHRKFATATLFLVADAMTDPDAVAATHEAIHLDVADADTQDAGRMALATGRTLQ